MSVCCRWPTTLTALGVVVSYWGLCIFIVLTNPPARILDVVSYAGPPTGDRSEEFRLAAAEMGLAVPGAQNLTWYIDPQDCGFRYNWATPEGRYGTRRDLEDDTLCTTNQAPDFYAVEGVTTFTPFFDPSLPEDVYYEGEKEDDFRWYKFSEETSDDDLLRHVFSTSITSERLGLSSDLFPSLVGIFLTVAEVRGPYTQGNPFIRCDEVTLTDADCEVVFDFEGDQSTEVRNSSAPVTEDILRLLNDLAKSDSPPSTFSGQDLAEDVCEELKKTTNVKVCSIECDPAYPYGAGTCIGSYTVPRGGSLPGQLWGVIFLVVTGLAMVAYTAVGRFGGTANGGIAYLGRDASNDNPHPPRTGDVEINEVVGIPLPSRRAEVRTSAIVHPRAASYPHFDPTSDDYPTSKLEGVPQHDLGVNVVLKAENVMKLEDIQRLRKPILTLSEDCVTTFRNIRSSEIDEWFCPRAAALARAAVVNNSHFHWRESYSVEESLGGIMLLWTTLWVTASSGWGGFYWLTALVFAVRLREETDVANLCMSLRYGSAYLPQKTLTGGILPLLLAFMELATDADLPGTSQAGLVIAIVATSLMLGGACRFVRLYGHNPRSGKPWAAPRTPEEVAKFYVYTGSVLVFFGRWTTCLRCGDIGGELATMLCLADTDSSSREIGHVTARSQLNPAKGKATVAGHVP